VSKGEGATDAEIIVQSLGNPDLFELIFDRHYMVIYRHIARRAGPEAAADVSSEVFVRAFASRNRYRTEYASARPWLFGIATNLLRQHFRSSRRASNAFWKMAGRSPQATGDATAAADARVDAEALSPRLKAGLEGLRDGDREVLLLYAWEDLSYAEIAAALEIPLGTVRSRLSRARRRFRELAGELRAMNGGETPPVGNGGR
jgi:RNA polymerase sigma-70 factor (ECF subfamily)